MMSKLLWDDSTDPNGVTYFVDEEGCYYKVNGDSLSIVPQPPDDVHVDEATEGGQEEIIDNDNHQTIALVQSENGQGEVSYVLVVQEETTEPVANINIKAKEVNDDDEVKEEEEVGAGGEDEDEEVAPDPKPVQAPAQVQAPETPPEHQVGVRPFFNCQLCSYVSHQRYLLLRHMRSHSDERPHKCNVCERGFKTAASLRNHVNVHQGVKPHVCQHCGTSFTTTGELARHLRYKHTHEKPHRCTECDYATVERSKLRRHVRCHTGERPYQCPHCTYASPDRFKLKRHLRKHSGEKPYQCTLCDMRFSQANTLKDHQLTHNVAKKPSFTCEMCPMKCRRKKDLRVHIRNRHTSAEPIECKRCGKYFPDRYSLKLHDKMHEGEKCFKCGLCPYATTALRQLRTHLLQHVDEKPFSCDKCDQTFRQKPLLRRHQNLHHNPEYVPNPPQEKTHSCRECNRTFARKGNLTRHLAIHDPDSGHHERARALKLGRQKKAKYVNGKMKLLAEESGCDEECSDVVKLQQGLRSNELRRGELVTFSDGDGDSQEYVVLEIIQLEDGNEQLLAVIAPNLDLGGCGREKSLDAGGTKL